MRTLNSGPDAGQSYRPAELRVHVHAHEELTADDQPAWPGSSVATQAFVRDSIGRLTALADSSNMGAFTTSYRYDALDRLDQVSRDGMVSQQLSYDLAGNRLTSVTSAGIVAATHANDDRILSFDGRPITHDAAGARQTELTASDSLTYGYDDVGRLTSVSSRVSGVLSFRMHFDHRNADTGMEPSWEHAPRSGRAISPGGLSSTVLAADERATDLREEQHRLVRSEQTLAFASLHFSM